MDIKHIVNDIYVIENFAKVSIKDLEKECLFKDMTINGQLLTRKGSFECIRDNDTNCRPILRCPSSEDNLAKDTCDLIRSLISTIESKLCYKTNIVKIQRYDDESIGIAEHSDKIIDLDEKTPIFILRIGGTRTMVLKHKVSKKKINLKVKDGDLLCMSYRANKEWTHAIKKEKNHIDVSYSMVFRNSITFLSESGYIFGKNTPFLEPQIFVDESKYLSRDEQKQKLVKCFGIDNKTIADINIYKEIIEKSIYPM